jgi:hypothetical protein
MFTAQPHAVLHTVLNSIVVHAAGGVHPISTPQAVILGVLQGVTELFPVSSLGHTVLFPTLFGWTSVVKAQSDPESFWLAFVVMLHVGSAVGLLVYFWRDWVKIVRAFLRTLGTRKITTPDERLAWRGLHERVHGAGLDRAGWSLRCAADQVSRG